MEKGNNQNNSSKKGENTTNKKEGQPKLNPQFTKHFQNQKSSSSTPKEQKKDYSTTQKSTVPNNSTSSNESVEKAIRQALTKPKDANLTKVNPTKSTAPNIKATSPQPTPKAKKTAPAVATPKAISTTPRKENPVATPKVVPAPKPISQEQKEQLVSANRIVQTAQGKLNAATDKTIEAQKVAQNKMGSLVSKGDLAVQALKDKTSQIHTKSTPDSNLLDKAPKTNFPRKLKDLVDTSEPTESKIDSSTKTQTSLSTAINKEKSIEQTQTNQSQPIAPKKVEKAVPDSKPLTAFKDSTNTKATAAPKEIPAKKKEKKAAKVAAIAPAVGIVQKETIIKDPITPKQVESKQINANINAIAPNEKHDAPLEMKTTDKLPPIEALGQSLISFFSKPEKGTEKNSTYWTAPISQKKDANHKMRFSIKEFFLFSSGVDRDILQHCPADESRFLGVGGTVIFTGVLAFLSSTYAIYTVFDNWLMAVFFGMIWGFMIYNLDRYIVGSMKNHGSWWKDMTIAFPRLVMAVLLALVISKPLELKIFEKEINAELITMEQEVYQEQEDKVKQRYTDQIEKYEASILEMTTTLDGLRSKRDTLEIMALREADGSGGSGNKNMGPIYKAKRKDADNARAEFDAEKERLMPLIAENQEKADVYKAELEEEIANLDQEAYGGMAARMEALHRLGQESEAIWWASMMIMLLFVIVEISPVLVKLISSKTAYDYLSLHKEHAIKMATQEEIAEANKQLQNRVQFETETNVYRTQMLIQLEKEMIDEFVARQRAELKGKAVPKHSPKTAKALAS